MLLLLGRTTKGVPNQQLRSIKSDVVVDQTEPPIRVLALHKKKPCVNTYRIGESSCLKELAARTVSSTVSKFGMCRGTHSLKSRTRNSIF